MLLRSVGPRAGFRTLTFSLPLEWAGRVSVVGNFNDWTPGHLTLQAAGEVARVSVELPNNYIAVFRYLAEGDHWFDEPEADVVDGGGSVVFGVEEAVADEPQPTASGDGPEAEATVLSPAQKAKKIGNKRREREEAKAAKAIEKARAKQKKLADKVTQAAQKQRKAAERVAKERERMAQKLAKKKSKKA